MADRMRRLTSPAMAVGAVYTASGFALASWGSRLPAVQKDARLSADELGLVLLALSAGTVGALLEQNPVWTRRDAENSVQNRLMLDVTRVADMLRTERWDLQALVAKCPVPVQLLAAMRDSALSDPDRSVLLEQLGDDHVVVLESGHTIHRERPGLWLHHVLRFADPV